MYSILFSILLASTYVSAIPMPLGLVPQMDPDNEAERKNKATMDAALVEANRQIGNMQEVLQHPEDPRIKTAFGPNPNLPEIQKVVDKLAKKKVQVQSLDPSFGDNKHPPVVNAYTEPGKYVVLGSTFFSNTKEQQAGTIIHEATHYLAGTGDHHDPTANRIIKAGEPKAPGTMVNGGYADTLDRPTASNLGPNYEKMRDSVTNTYDNADSYRVFASLCSRSLYKRALLKDDPVGYYLSKRQQCNLPPDYFEKKAAMKAAMKAAAEKGTTTAANKVITSPAAANGKASTAKSTGVKGAATKALRKGASTRTSTGVKVGKGLKTVRGTKAVKGLKTAKGLKMAKPGKGLKAVKGTKAAKGLKTARVTKTAKGLKTAKPRKGLKAAKGAKAIKGVKIAKGAKGVKAPKAGKGVKVAKGVKAVKGAQRVKGTSVKAVKAIKSPQSNSARKTVSGAKTATKATTKTAIHATVKAVAPKAAVKVAAAIPKKGRILPRDLGMILDELE